MAMGHSVHFVWTGDVERANRIAQQHPHTFGALRGRVAKQVEERR